MISLLESQVLIKHGNQNCEKLVQARRKRRVFLSAVIRQWLFRMTRGRNAAIGDISHSSSIEEV
jgi:hypothetical protein